MSGGYEAHNLGWPQQSIGTLSSNVDEKLEGKDVKELEQKRDDELVKFFKIKGARRKSIHGIAFLLRSMQHGRYCRHDYGFQKKGQKARGDALSSCQ